VLLAAKVRIANKNHTRDDGTCDIVILQFGFKMANGLNSDPGPWIVSRRRLFLIGLVVSVLAVNVGTRTFGLKISHSAGLESSSTQGMRQHLDGDAQSWVVPVLPIAILHVHPFHIPAAHPEGFPSVVPQQRPFDRPPPSC
jgi:hypothetical protein